MPSSDSEVDGQDVRERILGAAARLVVQGGVAALTTRAVAAAAAVQAPTLYRLFGDKRGLLDAVAERGLARWVAEKSAADPHPDPVEDLRISWLGFIAFGLANPAVFAIMNDMGRTGPPSPATLAGIEVLRGRVARIARAGRLRVPEERAVALIHAVGSGTVASLLGTPMAERDHALADLALAGLLAALVVGSGPSENSVPAVLAIGLKGHLGECELLSPGEQMLMNELLDRLASGPKNQIYSS